ncbi:MAG: hypothetical protein ACOCN0_09010, partial [Prevotella sp.]
IWLIGWACPSHGTFPMGQTHHGSFGGNAGSCGYPAAERDDHRRRVYASVEETRRCLKYNASALLTQCGRFSWYLIKNQVLHVIKLTDQSNLQTYYLKTDAKIAFFAPRGKIFLSKT